MFPARRVFGHDDRSPSGDRSQAAPEAGVPTSAMDQVARPGKADQTPQRPDSGGTSGRTQVKDLDPGVER